VQLFSDEMLNSMCRLKTLHQNLELDVEQMDVRLLNVYGEIAEVKAKKVIEEVLSVFSCDANN